VKRAARAGRGRKARAPGMIRGMRALLRCAPFAALVVLTWLGCDGASEPVDAGVDAPMPDSGPPPPFELTSSAYEDGGTIPLRYECGPPIVGDGPGENVTPALAWTDGPPDTLSYAIVMRDRDAGNLVHWVLYDIPASARSLPEDVASGYDVASPAGAHQAEIQGSGYFGYFGPCSPGRVNTYEITVHALPTATLPGADASITEDAAAAAIEAAAIASATLSGES
jgi:Raf kinase inhibitor-like YbhB/YbcL family protein